MRLWPIAAALLGLVASEVLAADLVVLESTAPGFVRGELFDAEATVSVPAGERVVFLGPAGPVAVDGPHEGPVATSRDEDGLIGRLGAMMTRNRPLRRTVGATRGDATAGDPAALDIVDATRFCLDPARAPELALVPGPTPRVVELVGDGGGAEFVWPAGQARRPWPAGLRTAPGLRYRVIVDGATVNEITLSAWPGANDPLRAALALDEAGCHSQAQGALDALAAQAGG